ncbi:uncharacterized protein C8Q71DRAFT_367665 [Rhodofomes roseus]|uniref:Uncharacterized protein n=1 Tax=Rhodofomes roseus TaxID=34475 RepID=A0ABQ8K1C8_9APHY|nr:uncharacterized protein C8Q71DRAFT_367665 [Rhodofomes roseus]KAH9830475.1 hypothetical protein C8Q71DRAFT_367665 [Rhodofomes roseus]
MAAVDPLPAVPPSPSAAMVDFPSSSELSASQSDIRYQRAQHLPFRRISLPSAPNLLQRQSVVSTASFDSLPEENSPPGPAVSPTTPTVIRNATRSPARRPSSVDVARKARRRSQMRPIDEQREAKRRKVINEFHETEKSYVDGLELIYSHFLTPIIASLDTPQQLLDRNELTSIFSNFIDIWNLHRSFYTSLTTFLDSSSSSQAEESAPPLSPVLLSHFPYLSLYTPFVSSFPDSLASYTALLNSHPTFAVFIAQQEADPRCGKLKFRDWLLTIVQRCPRYLLLLKDLIGCTDHEDPEYAQLAAVHTLVSKITSSLNASLHTHAQTLALLALQRNTANLPFKLITPGRTFLRRAPLLQLEGSLAKEREFLLFSDCLLWLASADGEVAYGGWGGEPSPTSPASPARPPLIRTRSKSDADMAGAAEAIKRKESVLKFRLHASPAKKKARHASSGTDERWVYKGYVDLVDMEVVVPPAREFGDERRLEVLSPQQSFAVYAANEEERDDWCAAIRNAKSSLLVSLNVMQPNSTLTSSSSTNHLRRTLQALPYSPEENGLKPKRGRVDHFVPAIWIPDGKAQSCMRCGRTFGWRRRRHHCRLCGRCVCGSCSGKTFFILDDGGGKDSKDSHKPARACDACYETVFPVFDSYHTSSSLHGVGAGTTHSHLTLSGLKSMPSLVLGDHRLSSPAALLAVDLELESPKRVLTRIEDESVYGGADAGEGMDDTDGAPAVPAIRIRPTARPRSYVQILEDFREHEHGTPSPSRSRFGTPAGDESLLTLDSPRDGQMLEVPADDGASLATTDSPRRAGSSLPPTPRKENTARRHKRFSLPAVALQTSPVTARPNVVGEGNSRRFSLVLGRGSNVHAQEPSGFKDGLAAGKLSELLSRVRG